MPLIPCAGRSNVALEQIGMVALYPCPNGAHVAWGVLGDGVRDMPPFQARELPPVLSAIKCIEIGGNLFDFTVAVDRFRLWNQIRVIFAQSGRRFGEELASFGVGRVLDFKARCRREIEPRAAVIELIDKRHDPGLAGISASVLVDRREVRMIAAEPFGDGGGVGPEPRVGGVA